MFLDPLDIPDELLEAQEQGKLVIFAGAGVSMGEPSNLPDFKGLAAQIAGRHPLATDLAKYDSRLDRFLGNLHGLREPFDYVTFGFEEFPDSYTGVSGGGIWYQRFIRNDGKNYDVDPVLAGIAVWQSRKPMIKEGWRVGTVTAHGWVSIYGQVRLTLYDKRANEHHTR